MSRFLRNRAFQVKVVKDDSSPTDNILDPDRNPYEGVEIAAAYAEVAKDLITHAALTIGGVWAAVKIVERICK
jgi:hypothetical protein